VQIRDCFVISRSPVQARRVAPSNLLTRNELRGSLSAFEESPFSALCPILCPPCANLPLGAVAGVRTAVR
jgi:hypothetical protein